MEVFNDYAYYYNAFYRDKDYKAETGQVIGLLKKYGKNIHSIINFGCGTGRHDLQLIKQGYKCEGIDISPSMIELARENARNENVDISFSVADIREYESAKKYDAVISLFHVMSYQNSNKDVLLAFTAARKALNRGGIFLFDSWYGPGVLSDKPVVRVKELEDDNNRLVRIARPVMHDQKNVVDVQYEILVIDKKTSVVRMINEMHHMRYFFRPEMEFFLQETGFVLIDNVDCVTLEKTDFGSWTSFFIARAI